MPHFLKRVIHSLTRYGPLPLFKEYTGNSEHRSWNTITYDEFRIDMDRLAAYWIDRLKVTGLQTQDVVGIWITGNHYKDLVAIYSVVRAGLIPEVYSIGYLDLGISTIRDLLSTTGGKALLYDRTFANVVHGFDLPTILIPELDAIPALTTQLPPLPEVEDDDMAMIFHTSGTTSGRPKPVPETHNWLLCQAEMQASSVWQTREHFDGAQDVFNNIGNFGNVGTATCVSYLSGLGQCVVQTSRSDFGRDEFLDLVRECGMNRMLLYVPWLTNLLDIARTDNILLEALKGMRQICYTGASLNPDDEAWIMAAGIPATTLYASTELGPCLVNDFVNPNSLPLMRLVPDIGLTFVKSANLRPSDMDGRSDAKSRGGELYYLFAPESSPCCPHKSIRNRPDGHNTGDLFEEVEPGLYAFRGRDDDWIRTGPHLHFCDTKSIEDMVLIQCANLVKNCTIVGHYKPTLVLFVEPQNDVAVATTAEVFAFKGQLLKKIAPSNATLFPHERIENPDHVVVVPSGSLDRGGEKSNIRRKTVEERNKSILDQIYESANSGAQGR
ncbi:acetyl-CoA synthetase-like protein [Cristinia sonorae]|uniref:Acetyl-CoA synthetase-like protein n=1 Tax=Cristinia sonorae TaxID=1940300 RepID=A0A8K0UQZ4_9AGAR|nr:acetyl-CoA synthetase-like protein [Cristinia sonorae]